MSARRPPIFGPEPWREIAGASWSHWDRWLAIVCAEDFDGDWTALADRLEMRSGRLHLASVAEGKLSHLDDLVLRLAAAGLRAADLAGEADRTVLTKARTKVLEQGFSGRDLTPAMRETPQRRLRGRALRGAWPAFPADPSEAAARLAVAEAGGDTARLLAGSTGRADRRPGDRTPL